MDHKNCSGLLTTAITTSGMASLQGCHEAFGEIKLGMGLKQFNHRRYGLLTDEHITGTNRGGAERMATPGCSLAAGIAVAVPMAID